MEVSSHCCRHHGFQASLLLDSKTVAIGFIHSLQDSLDALLVLDVQRDKGDQAVVFDELHQLLIELAVVAEERVRSQVVEQVGEVQDLCVVVQVEG